MIMLNEELEQIEKGEGENGEGEGTRCFAVWMKNTPFMMKISSTNELVKRQLQTFES